MAIQFLRGTKSKVASSTKVLADGQPLYETDTNKLKVGDGSTEAKSLPYVKVDTDSALSSTSTNPVQNKVVNTELGKKLSTSGGTMTGALTTKGIKLTSGTDYGTTLPSNPATNQLFFLTIGSNFILDNFYPVGSIYMNVNRTDPGTLFGGTWEQIQGRFLLGMSSSYPAGSQGGEATHTLTEAEMPSHVGHMLSNFANSGFADRGGDTNSYYLNPNYVEGLSKYNDRPWKIEDTNEIVMAGTSRGGGQAHNNMPPYLAVYIWKRTA